MQVDYNSIPIPTTTIPNEPAVIISNLNFSFGGPLILSSLSLCIPSASRLLLIGANGSGKTTLLRLLAGKRLVNPPAISILGKDPFRDYTLGVTYLGTEWASNPIVRRDVKVEQLVKSAGGNEYPDRLKELIDVMDIDLEWRMHEVNFRDIYYVYFYIFFLSSSEIFIYIILIHQFHFL